MEKNGSKNPLKLNWYVYVREYYDKYALILLNYIIFTFNITKK